jgi:hypothetical protein
MLSLKPLQFLTSAKSVRDAVDDLANLVAKRKEIESLEATLKTRLQEIALARGEDVILGNKFKLTITTEWQQRLNTAKIKAKVDAKSLAEFMTQTKVTKCICSPLIEPVVNQ